ncbi:hypothetical protein [Absidia glauca]|uniref:Uncharacterized protein n=1 Tax=Absidia glauca TaxID=4829 RepID=A0A163M633_ABSGL|nr:hypothetical protein [Absidia glauca]
MFGSPTAFLLATMITLAAAGGDYAKCETSDGSPWAYDCNNALLDLDDSKCYDLNAQSSGCKNINSYGSCTVTVCVDDNLVYNAPQVPGSFIKEFGQKLQDGCGCKSNNCRVGGYYHVDKAQSSGASDHDCIATGLTYAHVEFTKK